MCQQEEVLEIGATMVEVGERREIYRHVHVFLTKEKRGNDQATGGSQFLLLHDTL